MSQPGRVVVGVSGTPSSLQALRVAMGEAQREGVGLRAVVAWVPVGGEIAYRRAPCPELLRIWEQEAQWRLRNAFDEAFGGVPDVPALELVSLRGSAGPALVAAADRPDDLLVLAAGPRGGLARLTHGATARYCVAHAACPVLTVPAPALLADLPRRLRHRRPVSTGSGTPLTLAC
ncbi:universal stress protein [Streptacidiphilus jiangxiensis]|uniref:Nucleotide-binding universal stress protein, UspA family n=1 Tax=Streptacidiphilus jiangxiensis TaxID=235985 RepID=A0A1H7HNA4_STRJI|nr:universal stress protein [Streptacidiphilus jiangxiensis]SEK50952.1 Nucleotide-binding universal stress protein, UspA family [Streptacidiphilus jiangxiensis]